MFRKLTFAALISTGILGGLTAMPSSASAHEPPAFDHRGCRYEVLIRHRSHWHVHGVYRDRDDARREARMLEHRGFDARIERVG